MTGRLLIVHPYKHHALQTMAACVQQGIDVRLAAPLYRKGIASVLAHLPGRAGRKFSGYFHPEIPKRSVISPISWQLRRVWTAGARERQFCVAYDYYVAQKVSSGSWSADALFALQDYLPETCAAAKAAGLILISDQIINQSANAIARIARHSEALGLPLPTHDERLNTRILGDADAVIYPSRYCLEGISDRLQPNCSRALIPYGVDVSRFGSAKRTAKSGGRDSAVTRVLARSNTVRKGGHLLLQALAEQGRELLAAAHPQQLTVTVLGRFQPELKALQQRLKIPADIQIDDRDFAAADVPALMADADFFVMPSLSESMSLACLEAMAAGLPSILTAYCGVDVAESDATGLIAEDSVTSLSNAMLRMLEHRGDWPHWGRESKQRAQNFSWQRYREATGAFIADVLNGDRHADQCA